MSPYGVALERLRQHPLFSQAFPEGTRWARIPTQLPVFNAPTRTDCVKASSETRVHSEDTARSGRGQRRREHKMCTLLGGRAAGDIKELNRSNVETSYVFGELSSLHYY